MGCNPILERHCRVVATLTLTLGVNGPLTEGRPLRLSVIVMVRNDF